MKHLSCTICSQLLPPDAFRQNSRGVCKWCQWASPKKRALARYKDKARADAAGLRNAQSENTKYIPSLQITENRFVAWYCGEPDQCHYCGLTFQELKKLRLRRGGFGYFVSWDIDRKDSSQPYREGNIALSCFVCNMAKGNHFSEVEAKQLGQAVRSIFRTRLLAADTVV